MATLEDLRGLMRSGLDRSNMAFALRQQGRRQPPTTRFPDPDNLYGSELGRIGQSLAYQPPGGAELPPPTRYGGRPSGGLRNEVFLGEMGSRLHPMAPSVGLPDPGIPAGPADAYTMARPPKLETGANYRQKPDALQVAINRARAGRRLSPDQQDLLNTLPPDALAEAMTGGLAQRRATSRETLRQRGLARGQAKAMGRTYQGGLRAGLPPGIAGAQALGGLAGGELSPQMAAMAGLLDPRAAGEFAQARSVENAARIRGEAERDVARTGLIGAGLMNEDPRIRKGFYDASGLGAAIQGTGQLGQEPATLPPTHPLANAGLTNLDMMQLDQLRGNHEGLIAFGKQRNLDDYTMKLLLDEYGGSDAWGAVKNFLAAPAKNRGNAPFLSRPPVSGFGNFPGGMGGR